mmetsp:Transcript_110082/g.306084  ORF Transcript_110082/g.306084 Transcript_110082/m.306084 type:complete len:275 (+) Transcript_110082:60-884(+)
MLEAMRSSRSSSRSPRRRRRWRGGRQMSRTRQQKTLRVRGRATSSQTQPSTRRHLRSAANRVAQRWPRPAMDPQPMDRQPRPRILQATRMNVLRGATPRRSPRRRTASALGTTRRGPACGRPPPRRPRRSRDRAPPQWRRRSGEARRAWRRPRSRIGRPAARRWHAPTRRRRATGSPSSGGAGGAAGGTCPAAPGRLGPGASSAGDRGPFLVLGSCGRSLPPPALASWSQRARRLCVARALVGTSRRIPLPGRCLYCLAIRRRASWCCTSRVRT